MAVEFFLYSEDFYSFVKVLFLVNMSDKQECRSSNNSKLADDFEHEKRTPIASGKSLFFRLSKYVEGTIMSKLESFLEDRCETVVGEEHRHEYWEWFSEWQALIESELEEFRDREGLSSKEMFFYLREAQDTSTEMSEEIDFFMSSLEFERFIELLKDRRVTHFSHYFLFFNNQHSILIYFYRFIIGLLWIWDHSHVFE